MDSQRLDELLRKNNNHQEGSFVLLLKEGRFDVGLFNEVLGELMRLKKAGDPIPASIISKFGLFAFECLQMLNWHMDGTDTYHIHNLDQIESWRAFDSLRWCLIALAYDKPIDGDILVSAERKP